MAVYPGFNVNKSAIRECTPGRGLRPYTYRSDVATLLRAIMLRAARGCMAAWAIYCIWMHGCARSLAHRMVWLAASLQAAGYTQKTDHPKAAPSPQLAHSTTAPQHAS